MTPAEVRSRLAGDPTFDLWDETKQQWFCGRVIDIHSAVENMKDPDYQRPVGQAKIISTENHRGAGAFSMEVSEYLGGGPHLTTDHAMMELRALERTTKRLLAMPRPDHMIELATESDPWAIRGGDGPGGRRKWRNGVVTEMVHQLIEDAGVAIARTGKSVSRTGKAPNSEGSPSMKLIARVLDCLNPRKRRRTASTALSRVVRTKGKLTPKKTFKK